MQEHEADDGEEVDEDDCEDEGEEDGANIPGDRADHVPQRLLPEYEVDQLKERNIQTVRFVGNLKETILSSYLTSIE